MRVLAPGVQHLDGGVRGPVVVAASAHVDGGVEAGHAGEVAGAAQRGGRRPGGGVLAQLHPLRAVQLRAPQHRVQLDGGMNCIHSIETT